MNAMDPVQSLSLKQLASEAARRLLRTVLAIVVVGVAILVGLAVPSLMADQIAAWRPAGLTFGAATVLAVMKDLLQTLPTAIDYIISAVTKSLPKLFVQVAVAALGVGFAWYAAVDNPAEPSTERSLNLSVGGSLPPLVLNESGTVFATYLVFGEWESELKEGDAQLNQVDALINTLGDCIQDKDDTIDLVVRAYASSSGPDAKNLKLYKARGAYVERLLRDRIGELVPSKFAQFKIEIRDWKSLEAMKLRRLFKDTDSSGSYLINAGALNRRADVLVRSAGSCLPG